MSNSGLVGADAEQLDALARAFDDAAIRLTEIATSIQRGLHSVNWSGTDADVVRSDFDRRHRPAISTASSVLRTGCEDLRRQAQQQRDASAGGGGSALSGGPINLLEFINQSVARINKVNQEVDLLEQQLLGVQNDPAKASQWWASLSPDQKALLIAARPAYLLHTQGLPQDVYDSAQAEAFRQDLPGITVARSETTVEAGGRIPLSEATGVPDAVLRAKLGVERSTHADGSVDISVKADLLLGAGYKLPPGVGEGEANGGLTAGGEVTYHFATQAEADRFEADLLKAAQSTENVTSTAVGAVFGGAGYAVASWATKNPLPEVVGGYEDHITHLKGSVGQEVEFKAAAGGFGAEVGAEAKIEHDFMTGETTLAAKFSAEGSASLGPVKGTASGETGYELTFDKDMQPSEFKMTGKYSLEEGVGVPPGLPVSGGIAAGTEGTFTMKVDLSNPLVAQDAKGFLEAVKVGDWRSAEQYMSKLRDAAEITMQTDVTASSHAGFDAHVVNGEVSSKVTGAIHITHKPAYGSFTEVPLPATTSGSGGGGGW